MKKLNLVLMTVLVGMSTVFMGCPTEESTYTPPKTYYVVEGVISVEDWAAFRAGTYDDFTYANLLVLFTDARVVIDGEPYPAVYMGGRTEAQIRSSLPTLGLNETQIDTLIDKANTLPNYMLFNYYATDNGFFVYIEEELDGYGQRSVR